jgi:hypothetical protein
MKSKINNPNANWDEARVIIDQQLELVNLMSNKKIDEKILKKVNLQCPELEAKKTEESPAYSETPALGWDVPGCIDLNKPRKYTGPASFKNCTVKDFDIKTDDQEIYDFMQVTPEQHKTVVETLKKLHSNGANDLVGIKYEQEAAVPKPMSMKEIYQIIDEEVEELYQTILDNLHECYPKLKFEWGEYGELMVNWESRILSVDKAKMNIDKYALKSIREKIELVTKDQDVVRLGLEAIIKAELDKIF